MSLDKIKTHCVDCHLADTTEHKLFLLDIVIDKAVKYNSELLSL